MEWTDEKIEHFWRDLCGLKQNYHGWYMPCPDDETEPDYYVGLKPPDIHDLNALVKWGIEAVKRKYGDRYNSFGIDADGDAYVNYWADDYLFCETGESLAEAIYKALEEK